MCLNCQYSAATAHTVKPARKNINSTGPAEFAPSSVRADHSEGATPLNRALRFFADPATEPRCTCYGSWRVGHSVIIGASTSMGGAETTHADLTQSPHKFGTRVAIQD